MSNVNDNVQKAIQLIEQQKENLKRKRELKLKAETRLEEMEKSLTNHYKEIESLGFNPEKLDEAIAEIDKSLEEYNNKIMEYINELEKE